MTGEEEEEILWKQRAKLYRWSASKTEGEPGEWKERGIGDAKLLKHKESGKIRFLLRQEKTLKIVANHYGKLGCLIFFDKKYQRIAHISNSFLISYILGNTRMTPPLINH